jgi:hypothetical protein
MSKGVIRYIPWIIVVLALILVGCSGGGEAASGSGGDAPAAGGDQSGQGRVDITMDSVKDGVTMKIGEQAVLKLDPGFTWETNVTPELVVSKVKDAPLQEGEQAVFEAKLGGSAVVQAIGKATCKKDNPPCPTPAAQVMIKIKVSP